MSDFKLNGFNVLPPKDGNLYLVQDMSMNWILCSWWTSKEIYEASGRKGGGKYLDMEGFQVSGISLYVNLDIKDLL